jgi:uncharacterized protein YwqG
LLPVKGLLSVFVADDEEQQYFWGNDGYAKVFFFPEIDDLMPLVDYPLHNQPCVPVRLESSMNLPWRRDLLKDVAMSEGQIEELTWDIFRQIDFNANYLLGYPFYNTLAYDPRPDETWTSLLTLRSIDELGWHWHDGDKLMLFIEKDKLAKGDFSYIKSDAG